MLRSARKITLNAKTYQNYNGFLLAPSINLNGLILHSQEKVPEIIKDFLESMGAVIGRVKLDGELLVKLTGEFNISKLEIENFLEINKENEELQVYFSKLNEDVCAENMKEKSDKYFREKMASSNEMFFTDEDKVISLRVAKVQAGTDINLSSKRSVLSSAVFLAGKNAKIKTEHGDISGTELYEFKDDSDITVNIDGEKKVFGKEYGINQPIGKDVGIMSEILAQEKVTLYSTFAMSVKNSFVHGNDEVCVDTSEKGNLHLELDRNYEWVNSPYPDVLQNVNPSVRLISKEEVNRIRLGL